ncbi:geranylgeranylglycerol-phosphate geranylgeranyltransferase [Salegentibacter chungangensis]|uniref:Geranylgeranylglycerol-phosphate geranylgeranyltransferase n=1 Tax=Salegentibacter chungangensis TaxID=1335724 RepID=A0ABW3NU66_9FLAO
MYSFLKLIRYKNLIFIALTQLLIKYSLFNLMDADTVLSDFGYSLMIFANICLAASGYIINDIYDVASDKINKPEKMIVGKKISEKTATRFFFLLSIIGVGIGFYLANLVDKPGFTAIFVFSSALLYLYASYLQQVILAGNILISILVAGVVLLPGLIDLFPATNEFNKQNQSLIFSILLDYTLFAFLLNLLREMVKDQEDINGDYNAGITTLPIVYGVQRTNKVIFGLGLFTAGIIIYYVYSYLFENIAAVLYTLILILGPLFYFLAYIPTASRKKEFTRLSIVLKLVLFFGLISIGLHQYII